MVSLGKVGISDVELFIVLHRQAVVGQKVFSTAFAAIVSVTEAIQSATLFSIQLEICTASLRAAGRTIPGLFIR
jgi:hypothetical protein